MPEHNHIIVAMFASGAGSNAEAIIEYSRRKDSFYKVEVILTNREQAGIYSVANRLHIPIVHITDPQDASNILEMLQKKQVQVIALAGYMRLLPAEVVRAFDGRIINIHPSLLPDYGGQGMYGNNVHMAVFNDKKPYTGITIHLVDEQYDSGKMLCQSKISIIDCNSVENISEKVRKVEHEVYPLMLNQLCKTIYAQQ
ncbi:MAG: formyltransferase family protein [Ignavibacteria bacterium]